MKKLKLYLETSIWSHYYTDDAEEQMRDTLLLFNRIEEHRYDIFISYSVIAEIDRAKDDRKLELQILLKKYQPIVLEIFSEVYRLADGYMNRSALPRNSYDDAFHAAMTTTHGLDILVSWNCRHLANEISKNKINMTNIQYGYRPILIFTPAEVLLYEKGQ